jgi:dihydroceramidase
MYIMEINIRPSLRQKQRAAEINGSANGSSVPGQEAEQERQDERDGEILRTMWIMIAYGLGIFLGGFAIWNLDNIYCSKLRKWRHEIGLPWGIVLEGHGWWHVMTGIGAYYYIV